MPEDVRERIVDYYCDPDFVSPYRDDPGFGGDWRKRIYKVVEAWARHRMTDYDQILAASGVGGAKNKKAARLAVREQLRGLITSWRKSPS
jgi:hypothetical protein